MGHEFGIRYCMHVQQAEIVGNVGFSLGNSSLGVQFMLFYYHEHNILLFCLYFSNLFLYCCISEFFSYDYRYLSNQVANGSVEQFIDTARFVVLTVTRLFVQPFSFKPKFLLIQCCSAYIPACPEGSFFPSLLFVSATGLALSLESLTLEREILSLIFPGVPSNPSFDVFPFRVA